MNDKQLRSFVLAAQMKSFSKAAEISYISTPALINQVNLLEKDTDLVLFHRGARGISLTENGEAFYETANKMLELYDNCLSECHKKQNSEKLPLRICGINLAASPQFMDFSQVYSRRAPEVRVEFVHVPMERKIAALMAGEVQIAAVAEPQDAYLKDFVYSPLMTDAYTFVVSQNHPLAAYDRITMDMLSGYDCLCDRRNYRKEDPEEFFSGSGAHISYAEKELDETSITNAALNGQVVLRYGVWTSHLHITGLKVIPSDLSFGTMGLLRRKDAPDYVEKFVKGYLNYFSA